MTQAVARQFDCTICEYQVQTHVEFFKSESNFAIKYGNIIILIVSFDLKHGEFFYFYVERTKNLAMAFD